MATRPTQEKGGDWCIGLLEWNWSARWFAAEGSYTIEVEAKYTSMCVPPDAEGHAEGAIPTTHDRREGDGPDTYDPDDYDNADQLVYDANRWLWKTAVFAGPYHKEGTGHRYYNLGPCDCAPRASFNVQSIVDIVNASGMPSDGMLAGKAQDMVENFSRKNTDPGKGFGCCEEVI